MMETTAHSFLKRISDSWGPFNDNTMLRVESNTKLEGFTEYEEEILFDSDDPDFPPPISKVPIILTVRGNMSIASVHPAEIHSNHSSLTTLSHSLEDIASTSWGSSPIPYSDHVLTIEELRLQMTTCFTCGVSWNDSHVSLDCSECGGYALERPCLECDGKCGAMWKRDLSMSHASGKARWEGICSLKPPQQPISAPPQQQQQQQQQKVTDASQELATKLEKLSANS